MTGGGAADAMHPTSGWPRALARPNALARLLTSAGTAYAAAAITGGLLLWLSRAFYHDDAYISLRYVQRLLSGHGLSWNPGERVEGFTNPLWVAQLTLLGWLGLELPTASRVLGFAYYIGLFAVWRVAQAAPLMLLVAATLPGVVVWTGSGLETTSFGVWLALGGWLTQESSWQAEAGIASSRRYAALAGGALGVAALTRPEGAGVALTLLAWLAWRRHWTALGTTAVSFIATCGPYQVFRLLYFGELVPNTAHVKITDLSLAQSLLDGVYYFWNHRGTWVPGAATATVALACSQARMPLGMLAVPVPLVATTLLAGGDHMIAGRLIAPAMIVVIFAGAVALRKQGAQHAFILHSLLASVVVLQVTFISLTPLDRDPAAAVGEPVGQWLETALPAGAVVATATAGSTPYFAPSLTFIDTLGLNDRHIAHRRIDTLETTWQRFPGHLKGDGQYVLRRMPDAIILGPAEGYAGADPRAWFLTDFELLQSADFRARYRGYQFPVPVTPAQAQAPAVARKMNDDGTIPLTAYIRRDSKAAAALIPRGLPLDTPP